MLFLPQNDSHAETAALLDAELKKLEFDSVTLDLDGLYHQGTRQILEGMTVLSSGLESDRPFYRLPPLDQVRIVAAARPLVPRWLAGVDAVVAFNDGALQRLVLTEARRRRIQTDLVLDGMVTFLDAPISPRSLARGILHKIGRLLDHTAAGSFFPSEVGLSAVDRTHVPGEHSATVLRARGSRARQVLASGLPRWPDAEWNVPGCVNRVLYLTGSFRWHADNSTATAQERDIAQLAEVCAQIGLSLTVRVHPRDEVEPYEGLDATIVDARQESMTSTIRRSDLVLSIVSVGLIEAIILGKPSRVLAIHPRWSRYRRAFNADPLFGPIRDAEQLRTELTEMATSMDPSLMERQRRGLSPYVAATGATAIRRIAREIDGT